MNLSRGTTSSTALESGGTSARHSSGPGPAEDEGLLPAGRAVSALRWLVAGGPICGCGELDFREEFTITIGPAGQDPASASRAGIRAGP